MSMPSQSKKPLPVLRADAAFPHVALDDGGRRVALIAQRLGKVAARVDEDVAAAPVDELEEAEDAVPESRSRICTALSMSGRADATPSSTMRAASFMASAWMRGTMKPGRAAHTTGTLPISSSIASRRAVIAGAVPRAGRQLDERHEIGGVEPVGVEEALGALHCARRDRPPGWSRWWRR